MSKTIAQHSADYRARRTAKIERYEAALREVCVLANSAFDGDIAAAQALDAADDLARTALHPNTRSGDGQ